MSLSMREYGELLSKAMVIDGTIMIPGITPDKLMDLYTMFADDLFNMKVPHYRVVGLLYERDDSHRNSPFMINAHYNKSLIELAKDMRFLVPKEIGGNDPSIGSFNGVNEDMSEFENNETWDSFRRGRGFGATRGYKSLHLGVHIPPRSEVGCIMYDRYVEDLSVYDRVDYKASDLFYCAFRFEDFKHPQTLLPNKHIVSSIGAGKVNRTTLYAFYMRGTGAMDYTETRKLFHPAHERIFACPTRYDLTEFFVPRIPDAGDTVLKLTYLEEVDELVLQHIIHEYGKDLMNNEC